MSLCVFSIISLISAEVVKVPWKLLFSQLAQWMGRIWALVTDAPVEFEKQSIQDFGKIIDSSRDIYKILLNLMKKDRKMSTCDRLVLETLGSQAIRHKILPRNRTTSLLLGYETQYDSRRAHNRLMQLFPMQEDRNQENCIFSRSFLLELTMNFWRQNLAQTHY